MTAPENAGDDVPPSSADRSSLPFAAAVLAGGQSSRMTTDKAFLPWAGRRLLDRQIELLRTLDPAALILSGRPGVDYGVAEARVVFDIVSGQGPLGGLAAVLEATEAPHVVLVAVDLPAMTPEFLRRLLDRRRAGVGVVPHTTGGWEPLAAVYPKELLPLVREHLDRRELALHRLIEAGVAAGRLTEIRVPDDATDIFRNLNSPQDLAGAAAGDL